jgi:hypothetical protein
VTLNKGKHTLIIGGASKSKDTTTSWKFRCNGAKWQQFTVDNLNDPVYEPKMTQEEDDDDNEFKVPQFPLAETTMFWKSVKFTQHAVTNFDELKSAMADRSTDGYCEKLVENMVGVSNQAVCSGSRKDIGFYYRTVFPVSTDETTYYFKLPSDFGRGGVVILNGIVIKQVSKDIWDGGKSTKLDFNATLESGNHVLEVYGSENCCDGKVSW